MVSDEVMAFLTERKRVLIIGGAAVILHGLHRATEDTDVWMDPMPNLEAWAAPLVDLAKKGSVVLKRVGALPGEFETISVEELAPTVQRDRMVRLATDDRPVDVFYKPTNLDVADFEEAWQRAMPLDDGARLIDALDLIVMKYQTGRGHDEADIAFLQNKVETRYKERLRNCGPDEANELFVRFVTPDVAAFAARSAGNAEVRMAAMRALEELSEDGDPFAKELLVELQRDSR